MGFRYESLDHGCLTQNAVKPDMHVCCLHEMQNGHEYNKFSLQSATTKSFQDQAKQFHSSTQKQLTAKYITIV